MDTMHKDIVVVYNGTPVAYHKDITTTITFVDDEIRFLDPDKKVQNRIILPKLSGLKVYIQ